MKKIYITKSITDRSNEILNLYLKDIAPIKLFAPGEEESLYPLILQGNEKVQDRFVQANLRFVVTIAKKYQGQGVPLMDLISAGNIGLIKASKKFNPNEGVKFLSYAVWWIKQSIIEELSANSRTVKLPGSKIVALNKIHKAIDSYIKEHEHEPSYAELVELTGMPLETVTNAIKSKSKCVSVDSTFDISSEDTGTLLDIIPNNDKATDEDLLDVEMCSEINDLLNMLPIREATIVRMYYGFETEPMNLEEIGQKFGLTAERVRQIKDVSLQWLKKKMCK